MKLRRQRGTGRGFDRNALSGLLDGVLRKALGLRALRLTRIAEAWSELMPAPLPDFVWPSDVDGATLVLSVVDAQWLHELGYLRQDLLARIQRGMPEADIARIELRLGSRDARGGDDPRPPIEPGRGGRLRGPPRPASEPPAHALGIEPDAELERAAASVADAELRQALAELLRGRARGGDDSGQPGPA